MNYKPLIASVGGTAAGYLEQLGNGAVHTLFIVIAGILTYVLTNWFETLKQKKNGTKKEEK